jgi:hypothetical protein
MRLELDLSPGDWADYKQALVADLKRVGVVTPTEPVGIAHFVRLGVLTDDGDRVVVTVEGQRAAAIIRSWPEELDG